MAGYALILTGGYLEGSLVSRHRLVVDHADRRLRPRQLTDALPEDQLSERQPGRVDVDGWRSSCSEALGGFTRSGGMKDVDTNQRWRHHHENRGDAAFRTKGLKPAPPRSAFTPYGLVCRFAHGG